MGYESEKGNLTTTTEGKLRTLAIRVHLGGRASNAE